MIHVDIILISSAIGLIAIALNLFSSTTRQIVTMVIRIEKLEWEIKLIEKYLETRHNYNIKSTDT